MAYIKLFSVLYFIFTRFKEIEFGHKGILGSRQIVDIGSDILSIITKFYELISEILTDRDTFC